MKLFPLAILLLSRWIALPVAAAPLPPPAAARSTSAPPAGAPRLHVVKHRLRNGMTFLIVERRVSPTVAAYIRFKVGGVDDPAGVTGIAHLLEHMMFKGTSTFSTTNYAAERP